MTTTLFIRSASQSPHSRRAIAIAALLPLATMLVGPCRANSDVYRKTLPTTAWILTSEAMGSGVLVSVEDRLLLTNQHVVGNEPEVRVVFPVYLRATRSRPITGLLLSLLVATIGAFRSGPSSTRQRRR